MTLRRIAGSTKTLRLLMSKCSHSQLENCDFTSIMKADKGECLLESLNLVQSSIVFPFENKSGNLAKLKKLGLINSKFAVPDEVKLHNV